ncbi:MAG: trigger factor [Parcubacteria group bacterium]|jgi:trigger factor
MIKHEITKIPQSEIEIKVSVPWNEWKKYLDQAVSDLSKDIKISGFRPGKAPRNMVEEKIGKSAIIQEAAEKAIQKTYADILAEGKVDAIGAPKAEILKLAEENDLEYKIVTAVIPEVKIKSWDNEIKKINKKYKDAKIEIKDEDIEKEIKRIAESRAILVTVRREAKIGDSVFVDFKVSMGGVPIENGTSRNHPLILGKGVFIPGFEENIIGMKENEEKKFTLNFPKEYHEKNLAEKPAEFEIKLNLVQERKVPEINDEFAKSLGKFENLEAFKKSVRDGMAEEKKMEAKEKMRSEFLEELIKLTQTELPEVLIHQELHKMLGEFESQLSQMGMNLDGFLEKMGKNKDDLENEWKVQAEKRVKSAIILEEIAKEQEIKVENEKIEEEMNKTLGYYKKEKDLDKNIDMGRLYEYTKGMLLNEKVFEYLESL